MMDTEIRAARRKIDGWRSDPVSFVREVFRVELDAWQEDFLNAYNTNQRVAAKACKGPGKTFILACCNWHFLATRRFPKMAATSISGDNLRDGLWAEMASLRRRSAFLTEAFVHTTTRIFAKDHPEDWFLSARKWSKDANKDQQANTLAGLHAENIMFTIDEAGGVPSAVSSAAEGILANPGGCKRLLMAGNPTHLSGPLYNACTSERSHWHVIEITGDPDDPKRSPRISIEWARKLIETSSGGRDNPWVKINVLGQFPPSSLNGLLGPDDMAAAMARVLPESAYSSAPKILGVDVACEGDDMTVLFPRQGQVMFRPVTLRVPNLTQVAGRVANAIEKWRPDAVFIDATGGFGAGVVHNLQSWGHTVTGVHFSESSSDIQYYNKRAEMAFLFSDWVKNGGCLPPIPELTEEATKFTYFFHKDKMQIIQKEIIKEELGRSPDYFDAAMLTFAWPVTARKPGTESGVFAPRRDYDPLAIGAR